MRSPGARLQRLIDRYNRLYWSGKLSGYRAVPAGLEGCLGQHEKRTQTIRIDVPKHRSDRELRSTLLHEMCHAAAARHRSRGHDEKFFAQLERLLRVRAPITVANPEAGGAHILKDLVPTSFPLARSKMERIEARRANAIEQHIKATNREVRVIGDDDIIQEFEDHAWELSWKEALITIGLENGLTDETGRPLNARFRRLLVRARRAHTRGRRLYLDEQRRKSDPEKFLREWADRLFGKDGWVRTENGKYRKKNSGTGGFK